MAGGWRGFPHFAEARARIVKSLAQLPEALQRLEPGWVPVEISPGIRDLAARMDRARSDQDP